MIRPYDPSDCQALLDVWGRATAVAHPFLESGFIDSERKAIPEVYLPVAETWVWKVDGRLLGFISLLGSEIGAVFVEPDYHRCGIGRALIDHARSRRGDLEVDVFERNAQGRAFYAGLGFTPIRRHVHEPTGCEVLRLGLPASAHAGSRAEFGQ